MTITFPSLPPDDVEYGQSGHVEDHNKIVTALEDLPNIFVEQDAIFGGDVEGTYDDLILTDDAKALFDPVGAAAGVSSSVLASVAAGYDPIGAGATAQANAISDAAAKYVPLSAYLPMAVLFAGKWTALGSSPGTTLVPSANTMYVAPLLVSKPHTLSSIAVDVTVAGGTGSVIRFFIYTDNNLCYPGSLTANLGTVAADVVGTQTISGLTQFLPGNLYWIGLVVQSSTSPLPTIRTSASVGFRLPSETTVDVSSQEILGWQVGSVSGTLPDPFPTYIFATPQYTWVPRVLTKFS